MTKIRAFSLLELILVITIIGILVVVSFPRFSKTFHNLELNSFCSELQSTINYLHQASVSEQKVMRLHLDAAKAELLLQDCTAKKASQIKRIPTNITIFPKQLEIFFYPDGGVDKKEIKVSVSGGNTVVLSTKGSFSDIVIRKSE